jgi:hypothetical protein
MWSIVKIARNGETEILESFIDDVEAVLKYKD